jgi:hypothetical protein
MRLVHHAYSNHAEVKVPSLYDWEKEWEKKFSTQHAIKAAAREFPVAVSNAPAPFATRAALGLERVIQRRIQRRLGRIRNIYSSGTLDLHLVLAHVMTLILESQQPKSPPLTPKQAARKFGETCNVACRWNPVLG